MQRPTTTAIAAAGLPHRVVRTDRASSAEESATFQGIETRQLLRTIVVRRGDGTREAGHERQEAGGDPAKEGHGGNSARLCRRQQVVGHFS